MSFRFVIFFVLFFLIQVIMAKDSLRICKRFRLIDTIYYENYNHKLNLYLGLTKLNYNIYVISNNLHRLSRSRYKLNYSTHTPINYSFGFSYDKISLEVSFSKQYTFDRLKNVLRTKSNSLSVSIGGNKFIIEPSFMRFRGFYDSNSPRYDSLYRVHHGYYSDPSMEVWLLNITGMYFFNNKKYAHRSILGLSYHQKKSNGSWYLITNVLFNKIDSDSGLFSSPVKNIYRSVNQLNYLFLRCINSGIGYEYNFLPGKGKHFFLGTGLALLISFQQRILGFKNAEFIQSIKVSDAYNAKFSLGWTTDHFFVSIMGNFERMHVDFRKVQISTFNIPVYFTAGIRMNAKPTQIYQWFKSTKVYQWI